MSAPTTNHNLKGNTMTEYNEGDLVEGVKGESVIRGRLDNIGNLIIDGLDWRVASLIRNGFTIRVVEEAAAVVVLPTEPGIYQDNGGDPWELTDFGWVFGDQVMSPDKFAPFTRLEPVSETAKKVLTALNDFAHPVTSQTFPGRVIYNDGWDAVAAEFGLEL